MSTYTYRYVEVKKLMIDGVAWTHEELPPYVEHIGEVFEITGYHRPENVAKFYKATENGWEPQDSVESKWVPLKWYSAMPKSRMEMDENNYPASKKKHFSAKDSNGNAIYFKENLYWCNNGGYIRDEYISTRAWKASPISGKGLPEDVSQEVKEDIESEKYAYDITWVRQKEWELIYEEAVDDFRRKVEERFGKKEDNEIKRMLDTILNTIKDSSYQPKKHKKEDEEEFYEDTIDYLFEEEIYKLYQIREEIEKIEFIKEEFDTNLHTTSCRVIYYLA